MTPKIFVILPAYNEEVALRALLPDAAKALREYSCELCVADDGSTDETAELISTLSAGLPIKHLRHASNQGYGAALRTGFQHVCQVGCGEDIVITLDADRTHSPTYFPALIDKIEQGYEIVTASYLLPGGGVTGLPWKRRLMSSVVNTLFSFGCRIPGARLYTNGYRAYRLSALQKVFSKSADQVITENGFPGGTELFLKVASTSRVGEIPFVLHYENRGDLSRIRVVETILGYLRVLRNTVSSAIR